jgi:peptidoglycan hydrolase-like protein with peptidoglycan-binding domain
MPVQSPKRGAIPSHRSMLAAAVPYVAPIGAPPTFMMKPAKISMWGNDVHGDCVTAEEAFAKACHNPEIFISDADVVGWATKHGVLEGAYLPEVMTWMQSGGFVEGAVVCDDGPHVAVDWTNAATLQSAISRGPVKIGIAADQIDSAWSSTGGTSGWFATGFHADAHEDHCVSLCGYGSMTWLAEQLGVAVPGGVDGSKPGYAMFTWNSIGIIDEPSMTAITHEAWLRQPTTVTVPVNNHNPGQPTLHPGATGVAVLRLQRAIHRTPDLAQQITGTYDAATETVVKQIQHAAGLTANGVVDVHTWALLPDGGPMPLLQDGSQGAVVKDLQRVLTDGAPGNWGTTPQGVDGIFGDHTWAVSLHAASATLESEVGLKYVVN